MKTKILLLFSCIFSFSSFAQDSIFHLKDYKYRTKGYTALTLSPTLGGEILDRKTMFGDSLQNRTLNFSSWLGYNRTVSTDRRIFTAVFTLTPFYSFSSSKKNVTRRKDNGGFTYLNWQLDNRFFKNEKNWFWQLGNKLSGETASYKQSESLTIDKNGRTILTDEIILGFGKGRIEFVQDAQMALFILNDLKKQGLIETQPDAEIVNNLAQLITNVNNRRIFDFRRRRVYELTQIDSFIRKKEITGPTDIRHFTIINDNWAFAYNPGRQSGASWFFHIVPFVQISKYKTIAETSTAKSRLTNKSTGLGVGPEIGYENFKPVNMKWQRNIRSIFSWSYLKNFNRIESMAAGTTTKTEGSSYYNEGHFYFLYGLDYYPNNRTRLSGSLDLSANMNESIFSVKPALIFSTDYFISYRTRLLACFSTNYQYRHIKYIGTTQKGHDLDINFSVGISHAFL